MFLSPRLESVFCRKMMKQKNACPLPPRRAIDKKFFFANLGTPFEADFAARCQISGISENPENSGIFGSGQFLAKIASFEGKIPENGGSGPPGENFRNFANFGKFGKFGKFGFWTPSDKSINSKLNSPKIGVNFGQNSGKSRGRTFPKMYKK